MSALENQLLMNKYILNVASRDEIIATHTFTSTAAAMITALQEVTKGHIISLVKVPENHAVHVFDKRYASNARH